MENFRRKLFSFSNSLKINQNVFPKILLFSTFCGTLKSIYSFSFPWAPPPTGSLWLGGGCGSYGWFKNTNHVPWLYLYKKGMFLLLYAWSQLSVTCLHKCTPSFLPSPTSLDGKNLDPSTPPHLREGGGVCLTLQCH